MSTNAPVELRNEEDYRVALRRIEQLIGTDLSDSERSELRTLADLAERYEDETRPMGYPSLAGNIEFHMDQFDLSLEDLATVIGSIEDAAEVLAGNLSITTEMGVALRAQFGISPPPDYKFRPTPGSANPSSGNVATANAPVDRAPASAK